jgi:hypothetical protein
MRRSRRKTAKDIYYLAAKKKPLASGVTEVCGFLFLKKKRNHATYYIARPDPELADPELVKSAQQIL